MKHLSFRMKLTLVFIITAMIEGAIIGSLSFSHSKAIVVKKIRNRKCRILLTALISISMSRSAISWKSLTMR